MTAGRAVALGVGSGLGLICLLNVWMLAKVSNKPPGSLIIAFAGWTTRPSGEVLIQFGVSNTFSHRVQFGVGELQFRGSNGWPPPSMLGGGTGDWLPIDAGSNLVFSVPAPPMGLPPWRVPVIYEEEPPAIVAYPRRILGVELGIVRWKWSANRNHHMSFAVGPEMVGWSNQPAH